MRARVHASMVRERSFTRDASHELRTPLSVIRSTTAQALDDPGISATSRKLLALAQQSAEQLERTASSLLALARDHPVSRSDVATPVLPALEQVVLEHSSPLVDREVSLAIELTRHDTLPVAAPLSHILLSNLIGNAFAHSASGVIRVTMHENVLRIANPVARELLPAASSISASGVRRAGSPGRCACYRPCRPAVSLRGNSAPADTLWSEERTYRFLPCRHLDGTRCTAPRPP